ncbi:MAG: cell division protein FtsL [Succinivibrionaceae bacterium]|nr:cell division protein FtsL [Succinivibrionaceae bacterium]
MSNSSAALSLFEEEEGERAALPALPSDPADRQASRDSGEGADAPALPAPRMRKLEAPKEDAPAAPIVLPYIPSSPAPSPSVARPAPHAFTARGERLVPCIMHDMISNFHVVVLGLLCCALALFRIYHTQDTRDLTAELNAMRISNQRMHKEWLELLAQRQELSELHLVKLHASQDLGMAAPRTEAEIVITLR